MSKVSYKYYISITNRNVLKFTDLNNTERNMANLTARNNTF